MTLALTVIVMINETPTPSWMMMMMMMMMIMMMTTTTMMTLMLMIPMMIMMLMLMMLEVTLQDCSRSVLTVFPAGLTLTIPPRQKVAICGRSGSGKSTLLMGLTRMARKIKGRICIDGIEITERPLLQLRKFIRWEVRWT